MSREIRPPSRRRPVTAKRSAGNTLIGIFIGLLLGLALAAAVAYFITKGPSPFQSPATSARNDPAKSDLGGRTPGIPTSDKPRFDFYKILPGTEEAKPAVATSSAEQRPPLNPPIAAVTELAAPRSGEQKSGDRFFLQAGAFQSEADAENQKAKLALLGMEASIQSAALAEKGVWYRVRLGPYDNSEEMNRNKDELAKRGFEATVIRNP